MSEKTIFRSLALLVFLTSLTVYVQTMAVSVSFWDSGEFIATSYILGVPHSPGTPLYVLVGRVFCLLPIALSTAQKVNLLSAVSASLGVLMAFWIMVHVIRYMYGRVTTTAGKIAAYAGPLAGSFFLMFSDTYWTDASEAEVYALSSFVMGLCVLLALKWLRNPAGTVGDEAGARMIEQAGGKEGKRLIAESARRSKRNSRNLVLLIIYLLSLGIGFHLGTILVFGGIFILFILVREKSFSNFELIVFTFGFAVMVADMTLHKESTLTLVGLGVFAVLVIWSTLSEGGFALSATALFVLGISVHLFLYIRSGLDPAIDEVDPENWRALYAHLRREQYPAINVFSRKAPVLWQLGHFGRYFQDQFRLVGQVKAGGFNIGRLTAFVPFALGMYGIVENYIREKKTWALNFTILALNSIGLIVFLNFSATEVRERDYFYGGAFYFFAIFIGIGATALLAFLAERAGDKSKNWKRTVLPAAVVLVACSILPATHHWRTHDRSSDFIPVDYAHNILAGLEPDAVIFTNGDNDTFPLWYLQYVEGYRTDVRVANLSLLNTAWYIKQLRDTEPKIPLNMSDRDIDRMRPVRVENGVLWTRDLAVNNIIRAINWRRPVYFSVTVPNEIWERYSDNLEMQGMVRRLVPKRDDLMVNEFQTARNLEDIFRYRGFLKEGWQRDDTVYRSNSVDNMFINFSIAAFQVAQIRAREGDDAGAVRWAERSYTFAPRFDWPKKYLGIYYSRNGQFEEAERHYLEQLAIEPDRGEFWMGLASVYENMDDLEKAVSTLREGSFAQPDHKDLFGHGFRISAIMGDRDGAVDFVARWVEAHPEDMEFKSLLEDIDRILYEEFGVGRNQGVISGGIE